MESPFESIVSEFETYFGLVVGHGAEAVMNAYKCIDCTGNAKNMTAMTIALNKMSMKLYGQGKQELSQLFQDLYEENNNWCLQNLKAEDADFYHRILE